MKNEILSFLPTECPWRDTLYWFDAIDSTNDQAKQMAQNGAPHGTVLIAGQQTGGRGRMGRSFHSPAGKGLYLTVILRPRCAAAELMHLTCAAGVASCRAVESATGFQPDIKWINDLVAHKKKLGGILAELSIDTKSAMVEYAIIGIGINCNHTPEDFPPELQSVATSLYQILQHPVSIPRLAASLVGALFEIDASLLQHKAVLMETYRKMCITTGQKVVIRRGDEKRYGTALQIDDDGGLLVCFDDGTTQTVSSGEVSIRGMYGYV